MFYREARQEAKKTSHGTTERIQMRENGGLNCGSYSGDREKIQISGYISEQWELVIIRIWGIH